MWMTRDRSPSTTRRRILQAILTRPRATQRRAIRRRQPSPPRNRLLSPRLNRATPVRDATPAQAISRINQTIRHRRMIPVPPAILHRRTTATINRRPIPVPIQPSISRRIHPIPMTPAIRRIPTFRPPTRPITRPRHRTAANQAAEIRIYLQTIPIPAAIHHPIQAIKRRHQMTRVRRRTILRMTARAMIRARMMGHRTRVPTRPTIHGTTARMVINNVVLGGNERLPTMCHSILVPSPPITGERGAMLARLFHDRRWRGDSSMI